MMHEYDDIDRALFSLPLEDSPRGLRESIMAMTVHSPAREPATLGIWESIWAGLALALTAWLAFAIVTNPAFAAQTLAALDAFGHGLTTPWMLFSLTLGFSAVFMVSVGNLRPIRIEVRSGRS
jgi:hypothetical protein